MNLFHNLRFGIRALFEKSKLDAEMNEEMRAHIEMRTQENIEAGMSAEQARQAALRQFGWAESIKETCRDQRGVTWIEHLIQDTRFGLRMLGKNPGFTSVAVLTLALGIGANTAIFSVVNQVLLQPLPYPHSDELVRLYESAPKAGWPQFSVAPPNFIDWRAQNDVFTDLAAFASQDYSLTGSDRPERVIGCLASSGLFTILGVEPILGRAFSKEEDRFGRHYEIVLSHSFWQRRFHGDPQIIGKAITLNAEPYTVIGVMPPSFEFPNSEPELWAPIAFSPDALANRGGHTLDVIGRLKPHLSRDQAEAEMTPIAQRLEQQYPETNKGWSVKLIPLLDDITGDTRRALLVLLGAVAFVLLIACANVANLLLARAASRQKEFAIRAAVGAARSRVISQLLTESSVLALLAGILGILFAFGGIQAVMMLKPSNLPRAGVIHMDGWVLGFTLLVSILTGIIFGLFPALQSSNPDLNNTLKEGERGSSGGLRAKTLRSSLVVTEVALSLVLLVSAGLLIRSFLLLQRVNPGFNQDHVLTLDLNLPKLKFPNLAQQTSFIEQLLSRLQRVPGVKSVAMVFGVPMSGLDASIGLSVEGRARPAPGEPSSAGYRQVSPNYFRTLQTPILKGRDFTARDATNGTPVVIVSETFVRKFFPNENPIGKRITVGDGGPNPCEIVGIVGDVKRGGLAASTDAEMYLPMLQRCWAYISVVLRVAGDPLAMANSVRQEVWALDKDQPIFNVRKLDRLVASSVAARRFSMLLLGAFAGVALILASVGLYGLLSYSVTQRQHELGIRMALGAQSVDVLKLVITQGLRLTLIGVGAGGIAALGLTRLLTSQIFDVSPTDPLTFGGVSVLLGSVAFLACYIPARRATKVNPMVALRYE